MINLRSKKVKVVLLLLAVTLAGCQVHYFTPPTQTSPTETEQRPTDTPLAEATTTATPVGTLPAANLNGLVIRVAYAWIDEQALAFEALADTFSLTNPWGFKVQPVRYQSCTEIAEAYRELGVSEDVALCWTADLEGLSSSGAWVNLAPFMTDTALASDIVLPCAYFLETTDVILPPAVHSYMTYCAPAVVPEPWVPSELWIITELAKRLGLEQFPELSEDDWLRLALRPYFESSGLSLERMKEGPVLVYQKGAVKDDGQVAWPDLKFKTPSGRIELWSNRAGVDGFSPVAAYLPPLGRPSESEPFFLLTPHTRRSLHSQHFLDQGAKERPVAYLSPDVAALRGVVHGEMVEVFNQTGCLRCVASVALDGPDPVGFGAVAGMVLIHEGWWLQKGGGVNQLISERAAGMGLHAAYYEVTCDVRKVEDLE